METTAGFRHAILNLMIRKTPHSTQHVNTGTHNKPIRRNAYHEKQHQGGGLTGHSKSNERLPVFVAYIVLDYCPYSSLGNC